MTRISLTGRNLCWTASSIVVFMMLTVLLIQGTGLVAGKENPRTRASAAAGTPQPAVPPSTDPLDGDALDGEPRVDLSEHGDRNAPERQTQLDIERSGRPSQTKSSIVAYDNDPATVWEPGVSVEDPWLWLDLGDELEVREVRWLAAGSGTIEVEISRDRRDWTRVDDAEIRGGWQGIELADEARYIRLTLQSDAEGAAPSLAEVEAFGRDVNPVVSREQKAKRGGGKKQNRASRGERNDDTDRQSKTQDAKPEPKKRNKDDAEKKGSGRVSASATRGETRCKGDRERCEAREGKVSIEEDCETEGTCTIDVRADGGSAICDAAGGSQTEAGDGEGRKGGEGGECEAVANGGAVTIGDVNP